MSPKAQNNLIVEKALNIITDSLDSSKAEDIVTIDISNKSSLGDYMVIASGRSNRHVSAVADYLIQALKENEIKDLRIEGLENGEWVLIDTSDFIIHIFQPEIREFYNLEKMWDIPADQSTTTETKNNTKRKN